MSAAGAAGDREVTVALGERSYPVVIGSGLLARAGGRIADRTQAKQALVVSEPGIARRYLAPLERSLRRAGLRVGSALVPAGESAKSLRQAGRLYEALVRFGGDRGTAVVALGGGKVGDLAGFVAATWLRGVPFVQVPTTLLAMVDSSVGGKVAVNLPQGKNLAGAFHQPRLVVADTDTLASLPARERAAGMAEIVKAGAILDADFFSRLERDVERALELQLGALVPVIERACAIKGEVVARDERESGLRMLLNFGHTLGHAVETLRHYRGILHGEAVAIGMCFAARRSEELGLAPAGTAPRVRDLLARCALPTDLPPFPRRAYLAALRVDKKRSDAQIRYVVLRAVGKADTMPLTPEEILPAAALAVPGGRRAPRGAKRTAVRARTRGRKA